MVLKHRQAEARSISAAWERWGRHPDAYLAIVHAELLATT